MKKILPALLLIPSLARAELVTGINAVVNDSVVTYREVEESVQQLFPSLQNVWGNQPKVLEEKVNKLRSERIESLIDRQLILDEFKRAGYVLPESYVDQSVQERIHKSFEDRPTLTRTLEAEGKTFENFRREIKEDIEISLLVEKNISSEKIIISPHKIESYYATHSTNYFLDDQVKLRMIALAKNASRSAETAKKLAGEILTKIDAGTPFAEMASVYSEDPQRAQGGDRGWVDKTVFKKEISDTAFTLKPGQHSGIVDLPEAIYLLQVDESRPAHARPLAEVREEIEATLKAEESARLREKWVKHLREKSFVRFF